MKRMVETPRSSNSLLGLRQWAIAHVWVPAWCTKDPTFPFLRFQSAVGSGPCHGGRLVLNLRIVGQQVSLQMKFVI